MLLYLDDRFAEHSTGAHPESVDRIIQLNSLLRSTGWPERATCPQCPEASTDQLTAVHTPEYVHQLQNWCEQEVGKVEADTVVSRGSWGAALRAAGAAVDAVQRVVAGEDSTAFCAIRPPGHHALPTGPMGFCLFNNVAVAAQAGLAEGLHRVLIVDWDVHHGNGTQDAFYSHGSVAFYSIHRSPFYPGTGAASESGSGPGLGMIMNSPVPADITTVQYLATFKRSVEQLAAKCQPELILISAGFDAHQADPIGSLGLVEEDFERLTEIVKQVAAEYCQGRIVSVLEGGYHLDHMPRSVLSHLSALA